MHDTGELATAIERIWSRLPSAPEGDDKRIVDDAIALLDRGEIRCAERVDGDWRVNRWVKQALDVYFRTQPVQGWEAGPQEYRDKFPLKGGLERSGIRIVPPGAARYGSHAAAGATLMPSHVNLGVWVGRDSLIDTWVALGTCVQVGDRVKILPCTSVVGSLYPLDAMPAVIEDDCFIGSGCVVGAGVKIGSGTVLASNVAIAEATPIVDLTASGRRYVNEVPAGALVVPGSVPLANGAAGIAASAALVIGYRDSDAKPRAELEAAARRIGMLT